MDPNDTPQTSEPKPDADKCPECGGWIMELDPDHGVCQKCGAKLESERAHEQRQGQAPPAQAASGGVLICPKCGNREDADADALYCDQCGSSLSGVTPAATGAPEISEPATADDQCPDCGGSVQEVDADHGVCRKCGAKLDTAQAHERRLQTVIPGEKEGAAPAGSVLVCPKCGNREDADPDALYCDQCGSSLQGVTPTAAPAPAATAPDPQPTDGVCPDCGGPVVEVSPDHGVCKKCGEKLVTPEAQSRGMWGLLLALIAGAVYILLMVARSF